jgi:hypothetical protein
VGLAVGQALAVVGCGVHGVARIPEGARVRASSTQ